MQRETRIVITICNSGSARTGKSSLVSRFAGEAFKPNYVKTVDLDFRIAYLNEFGKDIKVIYWDTANPDRYSSLMTPFYQRVRGMCLVYDITSRDSFNRLDDWLTLIRQHASPLIKLILIGNKSDLDSERSVSFEEGKAYADRQGLSFIEVSAQTTANIKEAVMTLVHLVLLSAE
mmetsp:Transcript_32612/g.56634  ORF Transcript_32612/g.56634 Transcript_32612/m.56634 type:complete len:175 (+) Transcript_32612:29-553(+)